MGLAGLTVARVNLHLHSRYSDGTLWPEQIVERARQNRLNQVSLTDHDCMEGTDAFHQAAVQAGIEAIPGTEIDCRADEIRYNSEILGYFPGGKWDNTRAFCLKRMTHREKRIRKLLAAAQDHYQVTLDFEQLKSSKVGRLPNGMTVPPQISFGKPDLFEFLKSRGLIAADTPYPVFKRLPFLSGDTDPKPSVAEVIGVILSDRGIPVLPHPGLIFRRDPERMKEQGPAIFKWFREAGILALECNTYAQQKQDHTRELNRLTRQFAFELGLNITWGSDCHGPGHHSDTMEKFWGTERFPLKVSNHHKI